MVRGVVVINTHAAAGAPPPPPVMTGYPPVAVSALDLILTDALPMGTLYALYAHATSSLMVVVAHAEPELSAEFVMKCYDMIEMGPRIIPMTIGVYADEARVVIRACSRVIGGDVMLPDFRIIANLPPTADAL
jgi:hypothetical protein